MKNKSQFRYEKIVLRRLHTCDKCYGTKHTFYLYKKMLVCLKCLKSLLGN